MKKILVSIGLLAFIAGSVVAQSGDYTIREIRDPVQFREALNADINTITGRLNAVEAAGVGGALAGGKIIVGSSAGAAAAVDMSGAATINSNGVVTLSGNVPLARITNALETATKVGAADTVLDGEGSGVTNLNASSLASGNVPLARATNALETATKVGMGNTVLDGEGSSITNLNPAGFSVAGITQTFTNIVWDSGATTGTMTFVDGRLVAP